MEDKPKPFFSLKHVLRFCRTVRYLKSKQVFYRLYYPIKKIYYNPGQIPARQMKAAMQHPELQFTGTSGMQNVYNSYEQTFTFLNRTKSFGAATDWDFKGFGLLWSFHLHYFGWLFAPDLSVEKALSEINQYIDKQNKGYFFNHSYIASYRIVNWIRFCIRHGIREERIFASLYRQAQRLSAFPEYELMGNHLMENGIALVWAGLFFGDQRLRKRGEGILLQEFRKQMLPDGAHFEKSYTYHTILLKRLMELSEYCAYFSQGNEFYKELNIICSKMLSHVFILNKRDYFPPLFGDSNESMSVSAGDLTILAQNLPLKVEQLSLGASGIRKLDGACCTLFFNLGNIPASYQPGHAHADAFTFCLNVKGKPVFVDPGVSTYEVGPLRARQRSTAAHNTVFLAGADSAEAWASFRMGRRPECDCLVDSEKMIDCEHDGYFSRFEIKHRRTISVADQYVSISDTLKGWKGQEAGIAFHLYPGIEAERNGSGWKLGDIDMEIEGADTHLEDYEYAKDFNIVLPARKIVGRIKKETIRTTIVFR